jgi:hypothetical protein
MTINVLLSSVGQPNCTYQCVHYVQLVTMFVFVLSTPPFVQLVVHVPLHDFTTSPHSYKLLVLRAWPHLTIKE